MFTFFNWDPLLGMTKKTQFLFPLKKFMLPKTTKL